MNRTFPLIVAALFATLIFPVHGNSNKGSKSQIVAGQNNTIEKGAANSVVAGGNRNKVGSKGKQAIVAGGQNNLANGTAAFAAGNRAQSKHSGTFVWGDGQSSIFGSTAANQFLIRAQRGVGINTNNPQGNALSVRGNTRLTGNLVVTGNIKGDLAGTTGNFTNLTVSGRLLSGSGNTLAGTFPTINGGANNTNTADYATIGGGQQNRAEGESDTVAGGQRNTAGGDWAFIGGGRQNTNGGFAATIAGGELNRAGDAHAAVGGGLSNVIAAGATAAVIGGGAENTAEFEYSVIGGGLGNVIKYPGGITPKFAVIGGGGTNLITNSSFASTIGGGVNNKATNEYATIAGGSGNTAGLRAAVGGGSGNAASGFAAASVGGQNNTASGLRSAVGGGFGNTASENNAVVGGGQNNTASGVGSAVSGGAENTASTNYAAVPGGLNNTASGAYSFAAGRRAKAEHAGTFVWADSTDADFGSGSSNQFLVRAKFVGVNCTAPLPSASLSEVFGVTAPQTDNYGGMYVRTSGATAKPFYGYSVDGGLNAWTYVDGNDANKWKLNVGSSDRMIVTAQGRVGIGTNAPTEILQVGSATCTGSTWVNSSDRNLKTSFKPVDGGEILRKVAGLPISEWTYKSSTNGSRHVGPTAQDFREAFGLGDNDKTISTIDPSGVALAAIQGLVEELHERDKKIDQLNAKLEAVEERLRSLPPAPQ